MDKIKKQIMRTFLITSFALSVSISIFDSLYEEKILSNISFENGIFLLIVFIICEVLIFLLFSFIFYRVISNKIKLEVDRNKDAISVLFASLAHDIKTPLTSVIGYSQALENGLVDEGNLQDTYELIKRKGEQANEVLSVLMEYSKLSNSNLELNLKEIDLVRLVRECIANNFDAIERKNMEIEFVGLSSLKVQADPFHLSRAINNIIVNAIKHNPSGTKLIVDFTENSVSFLDDGTDISKDEFEAFLEPFATGKMDRTSGSGIGLGLPLTYEILKKHGYDLAFSSKDSNCYKGFIILL